MATMKMNLPKLYRLVFTTCTALLLIWGAARATKLSAAEPASTQSKEQQLAALSLELANASNRVVQIVEQPVPTYGEYPNMEYFTYREGWFHPGATKPHFNTVDVRKTQETPYGQKIVTSPLNPGIYFHGEDLEFNSMTKYFVTNRSVPKHKLTEAEMIEINSLYRIIGKCESEMQRLNGTGVADDSNVGEATAEPQSLYERIQRIPRETRIRYAGIGIGVLLFIAIVRRMFRKSPDDF